MRTMISLETHMRNYRKMYEKYAQFAWVTFSPGYQDAHLVAYDPRCLCGGECAAWQLNWIIGTINRQVLG